MVNIDRLSNQVEFRFALDEARRPDAASIAERNYKLLADIEGSLTIQVNGEVFFDEPGVLLLEFGVDLARWDLAIGRGRRATFQYVTMSYGEGPILIVRPRADGRVDLDSPWKRTRTPVTVDEEALRHAITMFLDTLDRDLELRYGFRIADFAHPR